jgi:2'-5' RNA ligase
MQKKFSIVTYLDEESSKKVREIQQKLFELTGSKACLDEWQPHTTVGSGIWVTESELAEAEETFTKIAEGANPFSVALSGFGGLTDRKGGEGEITTPYVLWIDVVVNKELRKLVDLIEEKVTFKYKLWYKRPSPYMPHVTVAFRDLTEEGYEKGQQYLKELNFEDEMTISHVALVERLPNKDVGYKRFNFGK